MDPLDDDDDDDEEDEDDEDDEDGTASSSRSLKSGLRTRERPPEPVPSSSAIDGQVQRSGEREALDSMQRMTDEEATMATRGRKGAKKTREIRGMLWRYRNVAAEHKYQINKQRFLSILVYFPFN